MKYITFLGAAGTVTGSSYFLHDSSGKGILIDLGMFQGGQGLEKWNFDAIPMHPSDIHAVFLTHAHLDHSGRLPLLRQFGYTGFIYMTEATKMLLELTLRDAARVAHEHFQGMALFTEHDVEWVLSRTRLVNYNDTVTIDTYSITFRDAGHILGSAFLEVNCKDHEDGIKKIVFSGDIGNYPEELVAPTEMVEDADVVLIESTYGDKEHAAENPRLVLKEEIQAVEQSGGTLLIPAFSVERTQELLHHIDHLKKEHVVRDDTPVYLDSPLGIHVTHVYQQYRNLYGNELSEHATTDDPFNFPGLMMIQDGRQSREIMNFTGTKIVIAGSGMMNGGRILRHAQNSLPDPSTRLLFVGFQAENTLGRELLDGTSSVIINGIRIPVRAHIRKSSGMSSHADQPKLLKWLTHIHELSTVCLVHGENPQRKVMAEKIKKTMEPDPIIYLPMKNETFNFGKVIKPVIYHGSSGRTNKKKSYVSRYATLSA